MNYKFKAGDIIVDVSGIPNIIRVAKISGVYMNMTSYQYQLIPIEIVQKNIMYSVGLSYLLYTANIDKHYILDKSRKLKELIDEL